MAWRSIVTWPKGTFDYRDWKGQPNTTVGTHDTQQQANNECYIQTTYGLNHKGKIFPIETKIEEI